VAWDDFLRLYLFHSIALAAVSPILLHHILRRLTGSVPQLAPLRGCSTLLGASIWNHFESKMVRFGREFVYEGRTAARSPTCLKATLRKCPEPNVDYGRKILTVSQSINLAPRLNRGRRYFRSPTAVAVRQDMTAHLQSGNVQHLPKRHPRLQDLSDEGNLRWFPNSIGKQ